MLPTTETALAELALAGTLNPGPWVEHSRNVGLAARAIAAACGLDAQRAYLCGLLHDIGRRTGIAAARHIIDGYDYAHAHGWDEIARVCLTHSFPVRDVDCDIGKKDITPQQYAFIRDYLQANPYDDYDKLIIVCDSLANAGGFCLLEQRFVDTTRRYGAYPFTVARWNETFAFKAEFERRCGASLYTLLPGIEGCIYR